MTLWIGNDKVLKSSSQWQLKEVWKLDNSVHELFIFKIVLIAILKNNFEDVQIQSLFLQCFQKASYPCC